MLLLADALGIPRFNWLGWSSGGNTGLVLAALYGDRLHRMASLAGMAGGPNTSEGRRAGPSGGRVAGDESCCSLTRDVGLARARLRLGAWQAAARGGHTGGLCGHPASPDTPLRRLERLRSPVMPALRSSPRPPAARPPCPARPRWHPGMPCTQSSRRQPARPHACSMPSVQTMRMRGPTSPPQSCPPPTTCWTPTSPCLWARPWRSSSRRTTQVRGCSLQEASIARVSRAT